MKKLWFAGAGLMATLFWTFSPIAAPEVQAQDAATVKASPLMWVMKDEDSTVYLFGTIHLMKTGTQWQTPLVMDAFAASDALWLEVNDADNPAVVQSLIVTYGIDPSQKMTDGLTPEDIVQLDAALKPLGFTSTNLMSMKKWLVGLMLLQVEAQRLGYDALTGVDMVLMKAARERGIPIHAFETSEQQVLILAQGTPEEDVINLRHALMDIGKDDNALDRLFYGWLKGDEAAIDHEMNAYTEDAPDMYQRLIYDRNAAWIPQIDQIMAGKGTVFIAVGAGHLVGKDSVIEMLRTKGYTVTQLQP